MWSQKFDQSGTVNFVHRSWIAQTTENVTFAIVYDLQQMVSFALSWQSNGCSYYNKAPEIKTVYRYYQKHAI